jgi:hypothetical protein
MTILPEEQEFGNLTYSQYYMLVGPEYSYGDDSYIVEEEDIPDEIECLLEIEADFMRGN